MQLILKLFYSFFIFVSVTVNAHSQQNFAELILGNLYGKTRQEVYQYLKSFQLKNDNDILDYSILEPLLSHSTKANDTVSINGLFYLDGQQTDGMSIYFYLGKAYGAYIGGNISIGNELSAILGKGKTKKSKVSAYGGIDIVETIKWTTSEYNVQYSEGGTVPTNLEVFYIPITNTIQKPVLKIYMYDVSGNTKPYYVEWGSDSNNVTNHCSSMYKLELVGSVRNLTFVIQCLNEKEVFRKDIAQSKGKKAIITYKDIPEGCDPVNIGKEWGTDDESVQSNRYLFKLYEGKYEHFSGSLYLDDCMD